MGNQQTNQPSHWLKDADVPDCMVCKKRFDFINRRHHCRACGGIFCGTCCPDRWPFQRSCSDCVQSVFNLGAGGIHIVMPQGEYIADSHEDSSDYEDEEVRFEFAEGVEGHESIGENAGEQNGDAQPQQARQGPTVMRINIMGMNIDVVGDGVQFQQYQPTGDPANDEGYWRRYRQEQERRFMAQQQNRANEEQIRLMRKRIDDDIAMRRRMQMDQMFRDQQQQATNRMHQHQQQMHQQMHRQQQQHFQNQQNFHRQIHQQNHTRMVQHQQQQMRMNHRR